MTNIDLNQFSWPIAGHEKLTSFLQKSISSDSCSHAYLFTGQEQLGKKTVAINFIASLLCKGLPDSKVVPCRACSSCKKVFENNHQNVLVIERQFDEKAKKLKKNISVEQIRDLQASFSLKSFDQDPKIAIITEAEHLNTEAANSLLKTLEEPKGKVVIILIASNTSALPATIASRCQVLRFSSVAPDKIAKYLVSTGVDAKKARSLAILSAGLPGKAIDFLNNREFYDEYQEKVKQFTDLLTAGETERLMTVSKISAQFSGDELRSVLNIWQAILRDLVLMKLENNILVRHAVMLNGIDNYLSRRSIAYFLKVISAVKEAQKYLASSVNPKLALEQIIITL
jgi:DNA polymerase-3 subunit delta'